MDPVTFNCIYMKSDEMTLEEVERYLTELIKNVEEKLVLKLSNYVPNCRFIVNMPRNREGNTMRHCYIWVTAREVFNELTLDRENLEKPTIKTPTIPTIQNIFEIDWAEEDPSVQMPIEIPPIKGVVPKFIPAKVERINEDYEEGKLYCLTKHNSITDRLLAEIFTPFITYGRLVISIDKIPNGEPKIFVTFDNPDDAYFALLMRKKYYEPNIELLLSFDYAKKERRGYNKYKKY